MIKSLRGRLFFGFTAIIVLTGAIAGVLAHSWAYGEAIEMQDSVLMQIGTFAMTTSLGKSQSVNGVDADAEIEVAHAGMTVPEIFARYGEPYFRDGEARVIARLLDSGPGVLATGGGAFLREETRNRIRDKAISIWLKADADIIMRRVRRRADRPLLQTADPEATVGRLIREREPVYQHADLTVWSRDVPHEKIVDECIEALYGRLCGGDATVSTQAGTPGTMGAAP